VLVEHFCHDLPLEFANYMHYIRALRFEDRPDYQAIRKMFRLLMEKEGYEFDHQFDWIIKNENLNGMPLTIESEEDLDMRRSGKKSLNKIGEEEEKKEEDG